ncbi:MAG: HAD family hydrolase [Flavobacteriia bacterium]|nr:HAD family hydrolase [Flavobacteriia bacterium]
MEINKESLKVIGFDADDTLWVNETYFRDTEADFADLMSKYETPNAVDQELFKKEMHNLPIYGYGIKGFMLSMVESAIELSNGQVSPKDLQSIIGMGKKMILHPVEVLHGVEEVLKALSPHYRLIVLTKGDLLDQERKLEKSGLSSYFHHVEVLSDKQPDNYAHLLKHLQINPAHFLMVGNSLKSDVLPLLEIGAQAIHVPFHTTWQHEEVLSPSNANYTTLNNISLLSSLLLP